MLPAQCLPNIVAKPEADPSESRWGADDGDRVAHRSGVSSSHGKLESACMGISPSSPDLIAYVLDGDKNSADADSSRQRGRSGCWVAPGTAGGHHPPQQSQHGGTDRRTESRDKGSRQASPANRQTCRRVVETFSFSEQITLSTTFCKQLQEKMQGKCQSRIQSGLYVDCFWHDFRLASTPK